MLFLFFFFELHLSDRRGIKKNPRAVLISNCSLGLQLERNEQAVKWTQYELIVLLYFIYSTWFCAYCVVNAAPCEIKHVIEITTDYKTDFTVEMRITYRMRYMVQP